MSSEPDDSGQVRPAADPLDEALEETFPASDPVAIGHSDHAGTPEGHRSTVPVEWFDDLALGMRFRSAGKLVTREDIKRFAAEFDPQPYHLDEEAAERTPLKPGRLRVAHRRPRHAADGRPSPVRAPSAPGPRRRRAAMARAGPAGRHDLPRG